MDAKIAKFGPDASRLVLQARDKAQPLSRCQGKRDRQRKPFWANRGG